MVADTFESAKFVLEEILDFYQDLTYEGFSIGGGPKRSLEERAAETECARQQMLTPEAVDQFQRCCRWLERQPRTLNVNRRAGTSYGLKEEVEAESGYVSNGMFIAAALACEYLVEQAGFNSRNAWISISQVRASNPNLDAMKPHPGAMRLLKERNLRNQTPMSALSVE